MKIDDNNNQLLDISTPEDVVRILRERGKTISLEEAADILNFLQKAEQLTLNHLLRPGPESLN